MVALTGPKENNIVWYSPIWQNHKNPAEIITGMMRRFTQRSEAARCKVIQFYDNANSQLIQEYR